MSTDNLDPSAPSAWSPLRYPTFRALWIAALVSNIGTWIQNVGAAWLMISLAPSPTWVALVQTATSLPILLLALPAGALADVIDRRRLLLWTQTWMLAAALALGLLSLAGAMTPWRLLGFTFILGLGATMNAPAFQAITLELVPAAEMPAAVALNGVGFNLARAVGPALGGLVVAAAGPSIAFLLNAASFLGVIIVLYQWRPSARTSTRPAEHVMGAIRAGLRYVRYAPALRAVLVHTGAFMICGSALWALLPVVAQRELGLGSAGYGILLGAMGAGAVTAATILPRLRRKYSIDFLVNSATVIFAAVTIAIAYVPYFSLLCLALFVGGMAWMTLMSSLNVAAQTVAPNWVRARALAVYLLVFQGSMALGSALWGAVATQAGIAKALLISALGLLLSLTAARRFRLQEDQALDLSPSMHWPEPIVASEPHPDQGPVLITVEYQIDPARAHDFIQAMKAVRRIRRRDGATRWGLFYDTAAPSRYLETFVVESWAEHLHQHERHTVADRVAEDKIRAFQIGDTPPRVSHLLYAYARAVKNEKGGREAR